MKSTTAETTHVITNGLPTIIEELRLAWEGGDLAHCKKQIKMLTTATKTIEDTIKQQLFDNLK